MFHNTKTYLVMIDLFTDNFESTSAVLNGKISATFTTSVSIECFVRPGDNLIIKICLQKWSIHRLSCRTSTFPSKPQAFHLRYFDIIIWDICFCTTKLIQYHMNWKFVCFCLKMSNPWGNFSCKCDATTKNQVLSPSSDLIC